MNIWNRWMNRWMDGLMVECMDGEIVGWIDILLNE